MPPREAAAGAVSDMQVTFDGRSRLPGRMDVKKAETDSHFNVMFRSMDKK
jgi:hypothetical protein